MKKTDLNQLTASLKKYDESQALAESLGHYVAGILQRRWPQGTDNWSTFIASLLSSMNEDRGCQDLLIQWSLERFAGLVFRTHLPRVMEVAAKLRSLQYTKSDRFTFNDLDNHAWLIPHKTKHLYLLESQSRLKLVIINDQEFVTEIHVRRIWFRFDEDRNSVFKRLLPLSWYGKHDWKPDYGDFRDPGYVASFEEYKMKSMNRIQQIEGAHYYWHELSNFLMDVDFTLAALNEAQTSRLSELHRQK